MTENGRVVTVAHTLYPHQVAVIDAHAKDAGMNSSAALRDIINMWAADRMAEAGVAMNGEGE